MARWSLVIAAALVAASLSGCGSKRPVLYPNKHYNNVGETAAQRDIDECMYMAENHGVSETSGAGKSAGNVAKTAAVGGAAGAAAGAVRGRAGRGAGVGAAGAAAGATMRELFRSRQPDPVFKNFVDRCLREKGYEAVGWK